MVRLETKIETSSAKTAILFRRAKRHPLVSWIEKALRNLGFRAHLRDIYKEVQRLGYQRGGKDLNKLIRSEIQKHSSDSDRFSGNPNDDLFSTEKKRSGVWELRDQGAPINVEDRDLTDDEIDQALGTNRLRIGIVPTDSQQALMRQRRGQARIHTLTVENYEGRCAVCDVTDRALLVASHVVGWAEAPEHRGDLSNVICLCRIHDALFEAGYWSLGDSLDLSKREAVTSKTICDVLDGMISFRPPLEHPPARRFVKRHRERAGFG
jgi:hypothetical protein